jgi:polysaccharide export outer membrane protein
MAKFAFCVFVLFALASLGQETNSPTTSPTQGTPGKVPVAEPAPLSPSPAAPDRTEPLIGGGDLLKVSVFGVKDFDEEVRVSARGDITLPLVGSVHVAGLMPEDAGALIQKKLVDGHFMRHPEVSIFQKEYATQGVSVLGEVQKPGVYPLLGSRRLYDVISMAGGTTPKSGSTVSIAHRDRPANPDEVKLTDEAGRSTTANVEVLPGDTVVVSKAGIVYVVGDVKNPSGVIMENGMSLTVLKALAMAGGTNPTAATNSAKLIRRTANGPQEIPIPLKKILSAKAEDLNLQPEDIVFVPNSAAKGAGRRGLEAAIQMATGLAIYRR